MSKDTKTIEEKSEPGYELGEDENVPEENTGDFQW